MLKEHMVRLEALIDASSVQELLNAIAEICGEKAEHIAVNWQDTKLAKQWDKRASVLQRVAAFPPFQE